MDWLTQIFDTLYHNTIDILDANQQYIFVRNLFVCLEDQGWCCQDESAFYNAPIVVKVLQDLHPDWFN